MNIPLWSFPAAGSRRPAESMAEEKKREDSPRRNKVKNLPPFPGRKEGDWSSKVLLRQEKPVIGAAVPSPESATAESAAAEQASHRHAAPGSGVLYGCPPRSPALRAVLLIRSSLVGEATDNFFNVRTVGDGLVLAESQLRRNAQIERLCQLPADIARGGGKPAPISFGSPCRCE